MSLHLFQGFQPDLFPKARLVSRQPKGAAEERKLFEGGPSDSLQTALGLMSPGHAKILLRVIAAVAVGWLPLFVLTALQSAMLSDGAFRAFLVDYAISARSLVAAPLLIAAEKYCLPRLSSIVRHLGDTELVGRADAGAFDHAVKSTLRLRDSLRLEIAVVTLTAAIVASQFVTLPPSIYPSWYHLAGTGQVSPAGWWHTLITAPILVILLLGWAWRLALWTRFLWLVSRMRLRLVPAHPDQAGGLKFLSVSVRIFSVLAFALGLIVAGTVANRVAHDGMPVLSFRYILIGFEVFCLTLFASPLLVFVGQLLEAWRRGAQEYGALARRMGHEMERKWLNRSLDADALETNDFSATTDLYAIAANVYTINLVPVGFRDLLALAIGAAVPFLPVVLMAVPLQVLLQKFAGLLF